MKTSEKTDSLTAAMAKARAEFVPVEKGRSADTGKFTYDYADLADIFEATAAAMSKHGLTLSQDVWTIREPLAAVVQTRIDHESGQWKESSPMEIPCVPDAKMGPAQLLGSAETYGRRYQVLGMLGIQPKGEDDDGHAASGTTAETTRRQQKDKPPCPKCHKPDYVYEDRQKGGWFCWKQKGGCGHNWHPEAEGPPAEEPFGSPTVEELKSKGKLTTADKLPAKKVPADPDGNFDHVGCHRKAIAVNSTDAGLDAALAQIKANKDTLKEHYQTILVEWFKKATEVAADNERVRYLDEALAKAKGALGDDAFVKLGLALDAKYQKEAVA